MHREVQEWCICACTRGVPSFPEQQELCLVTAKVTKFCCLLQTIQLMVLAVKGSGVSVKGIQTPCYLDVLLITEPRSPNHFTSTYTPG